MDEGDWRWLAQRALEELGTLGLDPSTRTRLREALLRALEAAGDATGAIREVLASEPALRAWADERLAEAGPRGEERDRADVREAQAPPVPEPGAPPDDGLLLGEEPTAELYQPDPQVRPAATPTTGPRYWRADVDGHTEDTPLVVGSRCTVRFAVDPDAEGALAFEPFDEGLFRDESIDAVTLTVQVSSEDFELVGATVAELVVPRTGRSPVPVRFDVVPTRAGACTLTATVHLSGNFVALLHLTVPAGAPGPITLTKIGRPPESLHHLEPRDMFLVIQRGSRGGYECIPKAGGVQSPTVNLPITTDELAAEIDHVQQELMNVINLRDDTGSLVFQTGVQIPRELEQVALRTLAKAGGRLFRKLFMHPQGGPDSRALGEYLRAEATDQAALLTLQVIDKEAAIPWALLYVGDIGDDASLDWQRFLGMRHIIEQVPLGPLLPGRGPKIPSVPRLAVGLNINTQVGSDFLNTQVAAHQQRWQGLVTQRHGLSLTARGDRGSVLDALKDPGNGDQIVYFYCHATAQGRDGDTGQASITMEPGAPLTLDDLTDNAGPGISLATRPVVFINACESADLTPLFYTGFVPYFLSRGARGVIGTQCKTPALFAIRFAEAFFDRVLDGDPIGECMLATRQEFLDRYRNPLGLLYAVHCDINTRIDPALGVGSI